MGKAGYRSLAEESMDKHAKLLTIEEASFQLKIPKYTLRFWEKAFAGILVPVRTKGGQRRFAPEDINLIGEIKKLREKGISLSQIERELNNGHERGHKDPNRIDLLASRVAEAARAEVYAFFQER